MDGKTIRGSASTRHGAYHVVSAFAAENQLVLGEVCVAEKSNEIEAVPELLDMVDVSGAIVTADAMSCQKAVAAKIVRRDERVMSHAKSAKNAKVSKYFAFFADFA